MDWNAKLDLFELLRQEHEYGVGTIAGVAANFRVHRRLLRESPGVPVAESTAPNHVRERRRGMGLV